MTLGFDSFGGKTKVLNFLFEHGLLNRKCPKCGQEKEPMKEEGRAIPRCKCGPCDVRFCCSKNMPLRWGKISNIPLFLFVVNCFVLRVNMKTMQALSGADYRTVRRYLTAIRDAISASARKKHEMGQQKLGGEGKVVEVDEMFLCHSKYNVGRRPVKEGVWVLGLTEVDKASHPIENPDALQKLMERERKRERAAQERAERRKLSKQRQVLARLSTFPSSFTSRVAAREVRPPQPAVSPPPSPVIESTEQDFDEEDEHDPVAIVHVDEDINDGLEAHLAQIEFGRQMSRLFSQSRKDKPKRTLFFILPDRKKETLHRFIVENVLPGSTIYTDEWKGYNGLENIGFVHKTICHKRRFSRFEFDGNIATRVTTNHIERMWVELRRTLKYMNMKDFMKYIWLETYRQMRLFSLSHNENIKNVLFDFVQNGHDD